MSVVPVCVPHLDSADDNKLRGHAAGVEPVAEAVTEARAAHPVRPAELQRHGAAGVDRQEGRQGLPKLRPCPWDL